MEQVTKKVKVEKINDPVRDGIIAYALKEVLSQEEEEKIQKNIAELNRKFKEEEEEEEDWEIDDSSSSYYFLEDTAIILEREYLEAKITKEAAQREFLRMIQCVFDNFIPKEDVKKYNKGILKRPKITFLE